MPPTLTEVDKLAEQLPLPEQRALLERLRVRVDDATKVVAANPRSVRGIWRGHFPEDFDVDAALKEIRGKWLEKWEGENS